MPGEIFTYGGRHIIQCLHKFSSAWHAEALPQQWKDATTMNLPLELNLTTSEQWFGQEQEGILPELLSSSVIV